jgi:CRISPR-associated protein Cmr2
MHTYDYSAHLASDRKSLGQSEDKLFREPRKKQDRNATCVYAVPEFAGADFALLPRGSFFLRFDFALIVPYFSKDDAPWNTKGNPIIVEWVYRIPMVRPTTWKGSLLFAADQEGATKDQRFHLFGTIKGTEDLAEGRLHFFPTFFADGLAEQVINPHDPKTRKGKGPVTFEAVGRVGGRVTGTFGLLYLALPGIDGDSDWKIAATLCCNWTSAMLTRYGFGAKKLKGWGLAEDSAINVEFLSPNDPIRQRSGLTLSGLAASLLGE